MLPFPKRRATQDEQELDDEDLVVVEEAPPPLSARRPFAASPVTAAPDPEPSEVDLAKTVNRPRRQTPSRRILDESVEHDVAGECLASIAAEVGSPYASSPAISTSGIRAAMERSLATAYAMPPPSSSHVPPAVAAHGPSSSRLPAVTSPPFVRTTTVPRGAASVPGVREATPPPSAFLRRSTPGLASAAASAPPSSAAVGAAGAVSASSVAPVAMTAHPEPTVIVVRERPKAAWAIVSAAVGAICAVVAMQLLTQDDRAASPVAPASQVAATTTIATAMLPAPPAATAVTAPVTAAVTAPPAAPAPVTASAAAPAAAAVMKFGEDQGVAIKAPAATSASAKSGSSHAPAGAAKPASKPARPSSGVGPSLPDGSIGLGGRADAKSAASNQPGPGANAPAPPAASTAAAPAPAPAPTEPPKKRVLTPEQQIAEAQLKASMK